MPVFWNFVVARGSFAIAENREGRRDASLDEPSPAAYDHDIGQAADESQVSGEWGLLIIPLCVCVVLLFVSAIGALPGG